MLVTLPVSFDPTAHARRRRVPSFGVGQSFERTVPVAGGNHRNLKRAGGWVHRASGQASTALGRAGDLGRHHGNVLFSTLGRGLATVGSQEGALLGSGIGREQRAEKQLTVLTRQESSL